MKLQEYKTLPNVNFLEKDRWPSCSGIYFAIAGDRVLYVGQAQNLRNRLQNHHRSHQIEAIKKNVK